jgi:hypothetical protein
MSFFLSRIEDGTAPPSVKDGADRPIRLRDGRRLAMGNGAIPGAGPSSTSTAGPDRGSRGALATRRPG